MPDSVIEKLDYEPRPVSTKKRFFSPGGWIAMATLCGAWLFCGWFATNGRLTGWGDLLFIAVLVGVGLLSLLEGLRGLRARSER